MIYYRELHSGQKLDLVGVIWRIGGDQAFPHWQTSRYSNEYQCKMKGIATYWNCNSFGLRKHTVQIWNWIPEKRDWKQFGFPYLFASLKIASYQISIEFCWKWVFWASIKMSNISHVSILFFMLSYLSFHYFPMAGQNIFFAFILQVMQLTKKSYENILSQNNGIFFFTRRSWHPTRKLIYWYFLEKPPSRSLTQKCCMW